MSVRQKVSLKVSAKVITKVKKLLHSYAISRPNVRLSLKILGGKGDNNWVYAGTQDSSVLNAIKKVVGSGPASQSITKEKNILSRNGPLMQRLIVQAT